MDIFSYYRNLAINTYHIDPVIFLIIYFGTTPIYYYGEYIMLKAGYLFYKNNHKPNHKVSVSRLLTDRGFIKGLLINRITWLTPYIYIFGFGDNISPWVYVYMLFWTIVTAYLCVRRSHRNISNKRIPIKYNKFSVFP